MTLPRPLVRSALLVLTAASVNIVSYGNAQRTPHTASSAGCPIHDSTWSWVG